MNLEIKTESFLMCINKVGSSILTFENVKTSYTNPNYSVLTCHTTYLFGR